LDFIYWEAGLRNHLPQSTISEDLSHELLDMNDCLERQVVVLLDLPEPVAPAC
jgi:hypothetical protein